MSTDLKTRVTPKADSSNGKTELDEVLESGIGDVSLRDLLGMLISSVGASERKTYLSRVSEDKGNGFYDRNLQVGTIPVDIQVPRTRSGEFRPASLPAAYQRGYNDETQALLLGLLASGRSVNAVKEYPRWPAARPITGRNFSFVMPMKREKTNSCNGSGPALSPTCSKTSETATVSVDRVPIGACFGEPVKEFDPRPVRHNIGDAQQVVCVAMIPRKRFPILARLARCRTNGGDPWPRQRNGNIESWTGVCL